MTKSAQKKVDIAHQRIEIVRDSVKLLQNELDLANYFTLLNNDDAQQYFNYRTIDEDLKIIEQEIFELNHQKAGNTLVPYQGIDGNKCIINKIHFLNHRWIIADFYAGDQKGEVLIKYIYQKDKPTVLETVQSVLYTK
ncbi:hydrolase [Myroides sp. LJL119]